MTDFGHINKLKVNAGKTAEYFLPEELGEGAKIILSPATQANKPYYNALLKKSGNNSRRAQAKGINASILESNRNEDRQLYAEHIIKDWVGIQDAEGNVVEFSKENAASLLEQLPDWLFDEIRTFASNPYTFLEDSIDSEEISKNS